MATRTLINAESPQWGDAAHTFIILKCQFLELKDLGMFGFSAAPYDPEPHGAYIFARAVAGEFGPVAEYVPPPEMPPRA